MPRLVLVLGSVVLLVAVGLGWRSLRGADGGESAPPAATTDTVAVPGEAVGEQLEPALSEPVEDSYYPSTGDPGVDSLHYGLDLTWDPEARELTGEAAVTFRATADAESFQLDLGEPLTVTSVTIDDERADFDHTGKDLVVDAAVTADREYTAVIGYHGTPEPVDAPATRSDLSTLGWTVTATGAVWTMQEPFGAFTWYPVNDQPSDKALYDFTIRVPAPWVGIANGTLESRSEVDGMTVTDFHLGAPASSYLITIGIGDYASRTDRTSAGTPLTYWVPRPVGRTFRALRKAAGAIDWIEGRLGPYPYDSAGILLVDSRSGMETQTLVTLGDTDYTTSPAVIVHEMVHQWYGDLVTPRDWRDVWMNEGMTMYLQLVYQSERSGEDLDQTMGEIAANDQRLRDEAGPPGDYTPTQFGSGNVYYCPALMWHRLRQALGDEEFWRLVREWPQQHAYGNADREEWFTWLEQETGRDLGPFFTAWIDGDTTPPADLLTR